jgi:hypothetical protein
MVDNVIQTSLSMINIDNYSRVSAIHDGDDKDSGGPADHASFELEPDE